MQIVYIHTMPLVGRMLRLSGASNTTINCHSRTNATVANWLSNNVVNVSMELSLDDRNCIWWWLWRSNYKEYNHDYVLLHVKE